MMKRTFPVFLFGLLLLAFAVFVGMIWGLTKEVFGFRLVARRSSPRSRGATRACSIPRLCGSASRVLSQTFQIKIAPESD